MKRYPVVLSIAGSDSSGGAGIQADLKAISALGAYSATAITAITVQNTLGVRAIHPVPPEYVKGQIEAVMDDLSPDAVKIGMINDIEIVRVIAQALKKYQPAHVVFDPVMISTSGSKLINDDAIAVLTSELMPLTDLITPNLDEAEVLTGKKITNLDEMKAAARSLLNYGSKWVLVKGGHLQGEIIYDVLQAQEGDPVIFTGDHIESKNVHGTGCTLSSSIATFLALGDSMPKAVEQAKAYITGAIRHGKDVKVGHGNGPLNHFWKPVPMIVYDGE
ncbi:MAG: bifunctional hydroxymethylpyrimidine kinase/phosphomethylpyrimidine kinase [Bacteroides sp.]|nr:bifunctional hydroxymethylpyrimidine kinase/phosphomethylpyrimidine kinase [Bacteroides sp.]